MQLIQTYEPLPHFHRIKAVSTLNPGRYFYFRDDGILFIGDNEFDALEVQASLGLVDKILFEDIQDAFRLGVSVGILKTLGKSECENLNENFAQQGLLSE